MQSISQIITQVNIPQRNPSSYNVSDKHNGLCPQNGEPLMQPLMERVSSQNTYKPYGDPSEKHKLANEIITKLSYKGITERLVHELVSCCDCEGETKVTHEYLANKLKCTRRTIINHMQKLKDDGVVTCSKNGWKQSNTTVLLYIKTKLINKSEKFSHYLNLRSYPKDLNTIIHYNEYESFFANSDNPASNIKYKKNSNGLNTPKSPQLAPETDTEAAEGKFLRSEWDVSRETLPDELLGAIWGGFYEDQLHTIILTLKRLVAPLKLKLRIVGAINEYAKLKRITNIGGYIVNKYKQFRDEEAHKGEGDYHESYKSHKSQQSQYQKPSYDPTEQLAREKTRLKQKENDEATTKDAEYYAVEQLEKCGIRNPRLAFNTMGASQPDKIKHYDDCKFYDERLNHYMNIYKKSQLER